MANIVFGGSSGIGKRIVKSFISNTNNEVINVDLNDYDFGEKCKTLIGDLRSAEFKDKILDTLKIIKLDSITWTVGGKIESTDIASAIKDCLSIELYPLIEIFEALLPKIIRDNTKIIVISSIAAELVSSQHCAYNITKSAIESFVKTQAVRIGKISEARINIIRPGVVYMPERSQNLDAIEIKETLEKASIPRLDPVKAEEIAELVFFLSSNKSSSLNGSIVVADGGESILDQYYVAQLATLSKK